MPARRTTASANTSTGTLSSISVSDGNVYGGISATMASSSPADERHAAGAAGERDDQALDQQLPDDGAAGGAHRGPHGQLALARAAARQQQVGDVGARDQQQEPHRAQQQPQPLFGRVADEVVAERLDADAPAGFDDGRSRSSRAARATMLALACSIETPSFSRPITLSQLLPLSSCSAVKASGSHSRSAGGRRAPRPARRRRCTARRRAAPGAQGCRGRRQSGPARVGR